jgi:acetate kinase
MEELILILNAGSSSLKFAVFKNDASLSRCLSGSVQRIGGKSSPLTVQSRKGNVIEQSDVRCTSHVGALNSVSERLDHHLQTNQLFAIGHRVVHGGAKYSEAGLITKEMVSDLKQIQPFDPEHLPAEIALIEQLAKDKPKVQQVACFDTAFHSGMPGVAQLIPIPRRFQQKGIRRYGFHGLSYEYLLFRIEALAGREAARGRIILAHLGNGASMAAVRDGKCLDTSMAFTPAAGLVMSTRSGDIDPGVATFLMRNENMPPSQFDRLINHESGLLGISETSSDMRDLLSREAEDSRAVEAVELFCYQAKKFVGAYTAVLGGLDALVFAGGIGEHAAPVRERICDGLEYLGIEIDDAKNNQHSEVISSPSSRVTVRVIPTDEELMIARSVQRVLKESKGTP